MASFRGDRQADIGIVAHSDDSGSIRLLHPLRDPQTGFDWGRGDSRGCRQLAHAILTAHFNGQQPDETVCAAFAINTLSTLSTPFDLTSNDIDIALRTPVTPSVTAGAI